MEFVQMGNHVNKFVDASTITNCPAGPANMKPKLLPMKPKPRVETRFPQSVRSGHQRVIRLVGFDRPAAHENEGQSGIELRVFLEPLTSPPNANRPE